MVSYRNQAGRVGRWIVGLLLFGLSWPAAAHNPRIARAIPLSDIVIDGRLDDWPEEMAEYPIEWRSPVFCTVATPGGSGDPTGRFRAGYDPEANLLYLAVVVRDEDLVVDPAGSGFCTQDLCGVYVDADHSGEERADARGAQLYYMVPEPGRVVPGADNPFLWGGDTPTSGVEAAVRQSGSTLVYEWAIPLFEQFPEKGFQIQAGKTIGFDVTLNDVDGSGARSLVFWTSEGKKTRNSDLFGDLVFVEGDPGPVVILANLVLPVFERNARVYGYAIIPITVAMLITVAYLGRRIRQAHRALAEKRVRVEDLPVENLE